MLSNKSYKIDTLLSLLRKEHVVGSEKEKIFSLVRKTIHCLCLRLYTYDNCGLYINLLACIVRSSKQYYKIWYFVDFGNVGKNIILKYVSCKNQRSACAVLNRILKEDLKLWSM